MNHQCNNNVFSFAIYSRLMHRLSKKTTFPTFDTSHIFANTYLQTETITSEETVVAIALTGLNPEFGYTIAVLGANSGGSSATASGELARSNFLLFFKVEKEEATLSTGAIALNSKHCLKSRKVKMQSSRFKSSCIL